MKLVPTFADLPDTKNHFGYCGVDRPTTLGRIVLHHRGIYYSGCRGWELKWGEDTPQFRGENEVWEMIGPRFTCHDLDTAVNASCTCGGRYMGDPLACPACMVWGRLRSTVKQPKR